MTPSPIPEANRAGPTDEGAFHSTFPVPTEEQVPCGRGQIKCVADFSRFRPDVLYERGAQIRRISGLFDGKGRRLSVEKVACNSEFLSSSVRHDVGEMYGGEMFESYGTTEFGGLVFERPEHSGIHTNSDYVVELLKDREEVAPGEPGEVVIAPKLAKFRSHCQDFAVACVCYVKPRFRLVELKFMIFA